MIYKTQKTKDWATRTPQKRTEHMGYRMVSCSCFTSGTRRVTVKRYEHHVKIVGSIAMLDKKSFIRIISYERLLHFLWRVWRYQMGNQNPYIEEEQTTQWPKEKGQKDKQRSTKHTYKTKDRVTRTPLKTGGELRSSGRVSSSCSTSGTRHSDMKLFC